MDRITAGFYARVSSDGQARGNTMASQVAALRERAGADGVMVAPDNAYVDEGWSGTVLVRPALERLRDAIAAGEIDRVYVLAPDRLARRYAFRCCSWKSSVAPVSRWCSSIARSVARPRTTCSCKSRV